MRSILLCAAVLVCVASSEVLRGQSPQTVTVTPALQAIQTSYAALDGKNALSDVTVQGTVERVAGSDDETGAFTFKSNGQASRCDMAFSSGTTTEYRSFANGLPAGSWVGSDGVAHAVSVENLLVDPGYVPNLLIANLASSASAQVVSATTESKDGSAVIHIQGTSLYPNLPADQASYLQNLSTVDVYVDPVSQLPVSVAFRLHPDKNSQVDIPTEIRYSNYQVVGGIEIPFRVQKYINNSLVFDVQIQNVALNSGLSTAQLSQQQ